MIVIFKALGCGAIMLSAWGLGALKAYELKVKKDCLLSFCIKLDELADKIRMGAGEIIPLIKEVFKDSAFINIESFKVTAKEKYFAIYDKQKIDELFEGIGKGDRLSEYERIQIYKEMLFKSHNELNEEYKAKSKVWQTVGISAGITVALIIV